MWRNHVTHVAAVGWCHARNKTFNMHCKVVFFNSKLLQICLAIHIQCAQFKGSKTTTIKLTSVSRVILHPVGPFIDTYVSI